MKYGKIIITEGYFDGKKSVKKEIREDSNTTRQALLADVVKCLDLLNTSTPEVVIRIVKDKYGEPANTKELD